MGYGTLVSLVFHNLPSLYPSSFCRNDFYACRAMGWIPFDDGTLGVNQGHHVLVGAKE